MRKSMKVAGSILISMATVAQASEAGCWHADEVRAAQVRDMQTELMVGALMCRADDRLLAEDALHANLRHGGRDGRL